ncbi:MAG: Ku protein [Methylophilus sp.]|uniref:non-homologous end joining protein Ku n=1 Tax=Methylophilus sp. TaxID=29541 RepID=UPI002BD68836|nr:Ku protein [Methylophilus sp.]HSH87205.1 Ku protein [Methylophilus sp.]
MSRPIWKGAISFGLVHIPVELHSASSSSGIDLDLLDKRDFAPVGYKRYNKVTGKEVKQPDIIKGYAYEKDEYVVLTDEDLRRANPESTQTIDILSFIDRSEIPVFFFEQPYYLVPGKGGEKVYALLRQTLEESGKLALGQVVIRTKQHLAALMPFHKVIVLNLLRYQEEIRELPEIPEPKPGKQSQVSAKEMDMALSLVKDMSEAWSPEQYQDTFRQDVLALVKKKVKAKQTHTLTEPEQDGEQTRAPSGSNVVDLMQLLKASIADKTARAGGKPAGKSNTESKVKPGPKTARLKAEPKQKSEPARKRSA